MVVMLNRNRFVYLLLHISQIAPQPYTDNFQTCNAYFWQDKTSTPLSTSKKPIIEKGWMRALIFLVVFIGVYLSGHWLFSETSLNERIGPLYAGAAMFALATL